MDTTSTIPSLEYYRRQRSQTLTGMIGDLLGGGGVGSESSQPGASSTCEVILTQDEEVSASGIPPSPPPPGLFTDYTRKLSSMECCICLMPLSDTGITEVIAEEQLKSLNEHLDTLMPTTADTTPTRGKGTKKTTTAAGKKRAREEEAAALAAAVASSSSSAVLTPSADEITIEAIKETKRYVAQLVGDLARCQHVGVVGCGHMFHYSCIRKHLATRPGCPLCRQSINRLGYPPFPKGSQERLPPPPPPSSSSSKAAEGTIVKGKQRVDHGTAVAAACYLLEGCCTTTFTAVMAEVSVLVKGLEALFEQKCKSPQTPVTSTASIAAADVVEYWPGFCCSTEGIRNHLRAALVSSPVYFLEEVYRACRLATLTLLSSWKDDGFFPYPPCSSSTSSSSERASVLDLLKEVLTLGKDRTDIKNWFFTVRSQYTPKNKFSDSESSDMSFYESMAAPHYNGMDWYRSPTYTSGTPFEMPHPVLIHACRGPNVDVANTFGRKGELTGQLGSCELLLVWLSDLVSKRHLEGQSPNSTTILAAAESSSTTSSSAPSPQPSIMSSLLNYFTTPPSVSASNKRLSDLRRANENAGLIKKLMPRLTWQLRRLLLIPGSSLHGHQDDFTHAVSLLETTGSIPTPQFAAGRSLQGGIFFLTCAAEGHPGAPPLGRNGVVSVKDAHNATKFQLAEPCINLLNIEAISAQYPLMLALEAHKRHTVSAIKHLSSVVAKSTGAGVVRQSNSTTTSPAEITNSAAVDANGTTTTTSPFDMGLPLSSSSPSSPTTNTTTSTSAVEINKDATSTFITSGLSPVTLCAEYMQSISKEAHERRVQEKEVEKRKDNLVRRRKIAEREVADLELWLQYAKEKEEVKRSLGYIEIPRSRKITAATNTSSLSGQPTQPLLAAGSNGSGGRGGGNAVEDLTGGNSNPFVTSTTATTTSTSLRPVRYGHDWAKNPFSPAGLQKAALAADIPELMGDEGGKGVLRDTCAEIRNEVAYLEAEYKQQQDIERRSKRKLKELTDLLAAYEEAATKPTPTKSGVVGPHITGTASITSHRQEVNNDDTNDVSTTMKHESRTTHTPSQQQCRIERYRSPAPSDEDRSTDDEDDRDILRGNTADVAEKEEGEDEGAGNGVILSTPASAGVVPVSQRSAALGGVGGEDDAEMDHLSDDQSTP